MIKQVAPRCCIVNADVRDGYVASAVVGWIRDGLGIARHTIYGGCPARADSPASGCVLAHVGWPRSRGHLVGRDIGISRVGGEQRQIDARRHRESRAAKRGLDDVVLGVVGEFGHGGFLFGG